MVFRRIETRQTRAGEQRTYGGEQPTYRSSTVVQGAMQRSQQTDDQCQENIIFCKNQRLRPRSETNAHINVSVDV